MPFDFSKAKEYLVLSRISDSLYTVEYHPAVDAFSAIYRCPVSGTDVHYDFNDGEFEKLLTRKQATIIGEV